MKTERLLTQSQLASVFQINEFTIEQLVENGLLPHSYVQTEKSGPVLRFNPAILTDWLKTKPTQNMERKTYIDNLRDFYQKEFPDVMVEIKKLDQHFAPPKKNKGYSLAKVPNKKHGFLYYVRYIENGKTIPSRWNTRTNIREAAEQFARDSREKILSVYHEKKKREQGFYGVIQNYYAAESKYLAKDEKRGRTIGKKTRSVYYNFFNKVAIPYLKSQGLEDWQDLTAPKLAGLQDHLLAKGNKPQTINRYMGAFRAMISHLLINGIVKYNPFNDVKPLSEKKKTSKPRGCYEVDKLQGVFNRQWKEYNDYLFCLMIYSTGLRNCEIEKIQAQDIITMSNVPFIDVRKSKTENGIRLVPIHPFVHQKLKTFIEKTGKQKEDFLFSARGGHNQSTVYNIANATLAARLNVDAATLEAQNITFYSGRHFWKTMMNSEDLGEVEEYFMGHKVSRDVAKRYNHRDKQGKQKLLQKAREVFKILDKKLFSVK